MSNEARLQITTSKSCGYSFIVTYTSARKHVPAFLRSSGALTPVIFHYGQESHIGRSFQFNLIRYAIYSARRLDDPRRARLFYAGLFGYLPRYRDVAFFCKRTR